MLIFDVCGFTVRAGKLSISGTTMADIRGIACVLEGRRVLAVLQPRGCRPNVSDLLGIIVWSGEYNLWHLAECPALSGRRPESVEAASLCLIRDVYQKRALINFNYTFPGTMEMDYGGECSSSSASSSAVAPQPQEPILLHPDVPDQMVCVKTGDGCRFSVRLMAMRHSNLYMLNAFLPNGEIMKEFDLGDISGMMFQKILEWCQHYPGKYLQM
jgi:hypothetical protein